MLLPLFVAETCASCVAVQAWDFAGDGYVHRLIVNKGSESNSTELLSAGGGGGAQLTFLSSVAMLLLCFSPYNHCSLSFSLSVESVAAHANTLCELASGCDCHH